MGVSKQITIFCKLMQSKVTCSLSQVVHKQGGEAESVRSLKLSSDRKLLVRSQGALLDFRFSILVHEVLQQSDSSLSDNPKWCVIFNNTEDPLVQAVGQNYRYC